MVACQIVVKMSKYCPICQTIEEDTHTHRCTTGIHTRQWRICRELQLHRQPLCEICTQAGIETIATVVNHIVDRAVAPELTYTPSNLQSLCAPCHNSLTRRQQHNNLS